MDQPEANEFAGFLKALFVVAIGLLVYGTYCLAQSPRTQAAAEQVPHMSYDKLVQNGPGEHRYITLAGACLSSGKSVAWRDSDTNALEMYHPLYAAHLDQEPDSRGLRVILCIMDEMERRRIRDDRDEHKRQGRSALSAFTCEVRKAGGSLPPWARQRLAQEYRGLPLDHCWVVIVGEDEPTAAWATELFWHGLASLLGAAAMLLGWSMGRRAGRWRSGNAGEPQSGSSHPEPELEQIGGEK